MQRLIAKANKPMVLVESRGPIVDGANDYDRGSHGVAGASRSPESVDKQHAPETAATNRRIDGETTDKHRRHLGVSWKSTLIGFAYCTPPEVEHAQSVVAENAGRVCWVDEDIDSCRATSCVLGSSIANIDVQISLAAGES
jgi:hypothetical protein